MKIVSLFSGIGGLELGLARAGFSTTHFAENDAAAALVIASRFPGIPNSGDVRNLTEIPGAPALVTAGFPCQNLSMVGDKSGIEGEKSGIVAELFRLLRTSRPPKVLIENVLFMLRLDQGEAMNTLTRNFEELGYRWAYRVLDSRWFGVPQRRRRVYMLAARDSLPERTLFADDGSPFVEPVWNDHWDKAPLGFYWTEGRSGIGFVPDGVPTIKTGSGLGIASPPGAIFPDGSMRVPTISTAEVLQGFPAGWTEIEGVTARARWKLVGNAVTSNVAEWIGHQLAADAPAFDPSRAAPLPDGAPWPSAAYGEKGVRHLYRASVRPPDSVAARLTNMPGLTWSPLSERAAKGFYSRAATSTLRFPPRFLDSVRAYSEVKAGSRTDNALADSGR